MHWSSRRRFLQRGALFGLAVGGTSGCVGDNGIPGLQPAYLGWLPAPADLPHTERYAVRMISPNAVRDGESVLEGAVRTRLLQLADSGHDSLGIDPASVDEVLSFGYFATVLLGSFDPDALADRMAGEDWQSRPAEGGYRRYDSAELGVSVAADTDAAVLSPFTRTDTQPFLSPVLAAKAGQTGRYAENDQTMRSLADALGDGDVVVLRDGDDGVPVDGVHATGMSWRLTETDAKTSLALVFEDSSAVDIQALERMTATQSFADYRGLDVGQRGRVGIITATMPTATTAAVTPLPALSSALRTAPQTTFDFTRMTGGEMVSIVHGGGESVPHSRLAIEGEGFASRADADQATAGRWAGETSHDGTVVTGGDQVTVGVDGETQLEVVYRPVGGSERVVLARGP